MKEYYTDCLVDIITNTNTSGNYQIELIKIKELIALGADVDYEFKDEDYNNSLLSLVCANFQSDKECLVSFNFEVAELLILGGAKINVAYDIYDEEFEIENKFTPLDYLILKGGEYGLTQDTYRLAKIMITSLSKKEMKHYLYNYRNKMTFKGLVNIFQEFGIYEEHMEYML